jgi:hypothetical protein
MASFGFIGNRIDRLTGAYQHGPTDFAGGDIADCYEYAARRREAQMRGEFGRKLQEQQQAPLSVNSRIAWAIVRTEYIPVYRIHEKAHFRCGVEFGFNWPSSSEWKLDRTDRYSPPGTIGYYVGLTLQAAEDEARHAGVGRLDPDRQMILVMECCFDNLLYLCSGILPELWAELELAPPHSIMDMYLQLMSPDAGNEVTDRIGRWARDQGIGGLIFPSARYDQQEEVQRSLREGRSVVPAVNFVELGSHLCPAIFALGATQVAWAVGEELERLGGHRKSDPVFAEQNIVLFDGAQLRGEAWPVIYQTFPLDQREAVLAQDESSRQARSYMRWVHS